MSTGIQWTDETWNPVVGCEKVSQGCKNCYAKAIHDKRHKAFLAGKRVAPQYAQPFEHVQFMPERVRKPLSWRNPRRVFVNSVSDLFHDDVTNDQLDTLFAVMALADRHQFQILTKRPQRQHDYMRSLGLRERIAASANAIMRASATTRAFDNALCHRFLWRSCDALDPGPWTYRLSGIVDDQWPLPNVWLGVSVERQKEANERIPLLLRTPAAVRFLSCEPLLGPIDLRRVEAVADSHRDGKLSRCGIRMDALTGTYLESRVAYPNDRIDWVIVGGESGKGSRPCDVAWIRQIVTDCRQANVPVFVKQLGAEPGVNQADADAMGGVSFHHYDKRSALYIKKLAHKMGGDPLEWPPDLRVRQWPKVVRGK